MRGAERVRASGHRGHGGDAVTGDEARTDRIPINRTEDTDEDWQIESLDPSGGGQDTAADQGGSDRS